MPITYLEGDATNPIGSGNKIIAHVCNDKHLWGRGFVLAISAKWPVAERAYKGWQPQTYNEDKSPRPRSDLSLGSVQFVGVEIHPWNWELPRDLQKPDIWVANMIGQHDIVAKDGVPPVRYEAIRTALELVAADARLLNASVHMPYIGCGLAGGDWKVIRKIANETLHDVPVFVYEYKDTKSRSYIPPKL